MKNAAGMETGSNTIKGVRLQAGGKNGRVAVRGIGLRALAGVDKEEAPEVYEEDLKSHLRALGKQAGLKAAFLKTTAPPRATTIKHMSFPPVPPTRLQEMIRFEVTENLAGSEAASYAWQSLSTESPDQMAIILGVVPEDDLDKTSRRLKAAGLRVDAIDAAVMALANAYRYGHAAPSDSFDIPGEESKSKEAETIAVVDVGASHTLLVLIHKNEPVHVRVMAGGGKLFTRTIARALGVGDEQAEIYKRMDAEVLPVPSGRDTPKRIRRDGKRSALEIRRMLQAQREARRGELPVEKQEESPEAGTGYSSAEKPPVSEDNSIPLDDSIIDLEQELAALEDLDLNVPDIEENKEKSQATGIGEKPEPIEIDIELPGGSAKAGKENLEKAGETPADFQKIMQEDEGAGNDKADSPAMTPPPFDSSDAATLPDPSEETDAAGETSGEQQTSQVNNSSLSSEKRKVSRALAHDCMGLAAAIDNSVMFARQLLRSRGIKLDKVLITGAGARLKGLTDALMRRLHVPVEPLDPFRYLDTSLLPDDHRRLIDKERDRFAVSVGAALSLIHEDALSFEFTTETVRRREYFLSHTLYNWYSTTVFAVLLALLIYTPYRNSRSLKKQRQWLEHRLKTAEDTNIKIGQASRDNDRVFEERRALEARQFSGDFLIRVLAELRKQCDENLFITELSTSRPQFLIDTTRYGSRHRGRSSEDLIQALRKAETLVERGKLYIRGIVRSDKGRDDAELRQAAFEQMLRRRSPKTGEIIQPDAVFEMAETVWMSSTEFVQRIRKKRYVMLEFVIECDVGDRFSPVSGAKTAAGTEPSGGPQ